MSRELRNSSSLLVYPFKKLKEWFTEIYESNSCSVLSSEDQVIQVITGRGRERFNLDAAIFYGKRMVPGTLVMAVIAAGPGLNPNFINYLPWAIALGISSGVILSVSFGLEKRRYQ